MIRMRSLGNIYVKRTLRPLYIPSTQLPRSEIIDLHDLGHQVVYPGMVAVRTSTGLVSVGGNRQPIGLMANFINGTLDELRGGIEIGVWPLKDTWEVLTDNQGHVPVDQSVWANAGGETIYTNYHGQLTRDDSGHPVGKVLAVPMPSKMIVEFTTIDFSITTVTPYDLGYGSPILTDPQYKDDPDYLMGQQDAMGDLFDDYS